MSGPRSLSPLHPDLLGKPKHPPPRRPGGFPHALPCELEREQSASPGLSTCLSARRGTLQGQSRGEASLQPMQPPCLDLPAGPSHARPVGLWDGSHC